MFKNIRIAPRIVLLIVVPLLLITVIGLIGLLGLLDASRATQRLDISVRGATQLASLADDLRGEMMPTVHRINNASMPWAEGRERLAQARNDFTEDWNALMELAEQEESELGIAERLEPHRAGIIESLDTITTLFEEEDRVNLSLFVNNELDEKVSPFLDELGAITRATQAEAAATSSEVVTSGERLFWMTAGTVVIGSMLLSALGMIVLYSISDPVNRLREAVDEIAKGNYDYRVDLEGANELAELGSTFDELVEDKVATLAAAEKENEQLNDSVSEILRAMSDISRHDLTVSVPVSQDVTGAVSDSINMTVDAFSNALSEVSRVAEQVEAASRSANATAESLDSTASAQREEVEKTARLLADTSEQLQRVSELARQANETAERTRAATSEALETVQRNATGMAEIREAIQETGKRLKRLGERSSEINNAVDIINTIAERTNVLALNASMQAAAAGEAGRSFSVVAEEIQSLAGNARDATSQISTLVKNIQVDTNDTITTMDRTIGQVAEGTKLAEAAGGQMNETRERTDGLVHSVQEIAGSMQKQAELGQQLQERSNAIVTRTQETGQAVESQRQQTVKLQHYAGELVTTVRGFRLPFTESADEAAPAVESEAPVPADSPQMAEHGVS